MNVIDRVINGLGVNEVQILDLYRQPLLNTKKIYQCDFLRYLVYILMFPGFPYDGYLSY